MEDIIIITAIVLSCFMFCGDPDLHDVLIERLRECPTKCECDSNLEKE